MRSLPVSTRLLAAALPSAAVRPFVSEAFFDSHALYLRWLDSWDLLLYRLVSDPKACGEEDGEGDEEEVEGFQTPAAQTEEYA